MVNFSIIIPHKNIPHLLRRCLDSIPNREDIQIIVVDDDSDPQIVDFENFPGKDRAQVETYFTEEGRGAGYARNIGLQHARGKWILFSDADDLFTEYIDDILEKYVNSNYDIIYFKIKSIDCESGLPSSRGDIVNAIIQKAINTKNWDILRYQRLEPWAKIMSHKLVELNNITFDETIAANDLMFSIKSATVARNIFVDETPLYCLTARYGSLAHTISLKVCDAKYNVVLNVNDFLYRIAKYKYRINSFHYAWQFHYFGISLMIKKCLHIFRKMPLLYATIDFIHYLGHLVKTILDKKSVLVKIE